MNMVFKMESEHQETNLTLRREGQKGIKDRLKGGTLAGRPPPPSYYSPMYELLGRK